MSCFDSDSYVCWGRFSIKIIRMPFYLEVYQLPKIAIGDQVLWAAPKKASKYIWTGNPYWRGRISTVDLLVPTSLDQLILSLKTSFTACKTSDRTSPSSSVSLPWYENVIFFCFRILFKTTACRLSRWINGSSCRWFDTSGAELPRSFGTWFQFYKTFFSSSPTKLTLVYLSSLA